PVILLDVIFARRLIARAWNHTHDGQRRRILFVRLVVVDLLTDGVFAVKIFLRERFVDDNRTPLVSAVVGSEGAPAQQRHSHHAKVSGVTTLISASGLLPGG